MNGVDDAAADLVRIRLDLAYDGTGFSGWATQPGRRTVQAVLEQSLSTVLRLPESARLTVAGRTDAGVHARSQVTHLDIPRAAWQSVPGRSALTPGDSLVARLSGVLAQEYSAMVGGVAPGATAAAPGLTQVPRGASDVVVYQATEAPAGFDARFSALWRRYRYRIADTPQALDPVRRCAVLTHRQPLDVAAMNAAAVGLLGEHDFAAYCKPREGATTVRELLDLRWRRVPAGEPDAGLVVAEVRADAFCHSMVRGLVGASLAVGAGRRDVAWPSQVLQGGKRHHAVTVAPAHGLTLEEVRYPPDAEVAARAAAARTLRELPPR
ncbi:tRNA pseudouridine synthase A [Bogoriella caseilytica]|uniref:tRNA pseudouridine synthase A n=1 Tax=Bogoriella caseilytica TaxID=56055 RepID=UPI001FEA19E5|nr:tRNA pseudouridine synthase A [Bogoriella caseilytica]